MAEFRVTSAERALLLPKVGEGYVTYHETEEARAFTRAILQRLLLVSTPPIPTAEEEKEAQGTPRKGREGREFQLDVSVHATEHILPGVGTASLCVGLDVRGHSLTWRLSLPTLGLHVAHTEPLVDLTHITSTLMEKAGGMVAPDVTGLEGRYLSDPKFRRLLCEWAEAAVQVRDFEASGGGRVQAVGLALGLSVGLSEDTSDDVATEQAQGRWVTLATEPRVHPSLLQGHGPTEAEAPTKAEGSDVAPEAAVVEGRVSMRATGGSREGLARASEPRLIRSLWEKRLVVRMMTKMPVFEDFSLLDEQEQGQEEESEVAGSGRGDGEGGGEEKGEENPQDGEEASEAGGSTGTQLISQPPASLGSLTHTMPGSSVSSGGASKTQLMATTGGARMEEVEVRAWESYTGGSGGPPHRVYRLMVIDRARGGVATLTINASKRMPQVHTRPSFVFQFGEVELLSL